MSKNGYVWAALWLAEKLVEGQKVRIAVSHTFSLTGERKYVCVKRIDLGNGKISNSNTMNKFLVSNFRVYEKIVQRDMYN